TTWDGGWRYASPRRGLRFHRGHPQYHFAVALAGPAQGRELVQHGRVQMDKVVARRVALGWPFPCSLRQAGLDRSIGGGGDGNADHGANRITAQTTGLQLL